MLKKLKDGSGEVFGFLALAPAMVMLLVMLIGIVEIGSFKERLEYTTYAAGRAAAVSGTLESAKENAKKVAEQNLATYGNIIVPGSTRVTVGYSDAGGSEWKKGNYIVCEVSVKFQTISPFLKGRKRMALVMAIERS